MIGCGRYRVDDASDGGLERVGEPDHLHLALGCRGRLQILLFGLHPLDADQIVLEGVGRTGVVADFVAAVGEGNLDRLVAVCQFQQHVADATDRAGDSQHREQRGADQNQHHEHTDNERDGADAIQRRQQLGLTSGRELGTHVHGLANPDADLGSGRKYTFVENAHLGFLGLHEIGRFRPEAIRDDDQSVDAGLDILVTGEAACALEHIDHLIGAAGDDILLIRFGGGSESPAGGAGGAERRVGLPQPGFDAEMIGRSGKDRRCEKLLDGAGPRIAGLVSRLDPGKHQSPGCSQFGACGQGCIHIGPDVAEHLPCFGAYGPLRGGIDLRSGLGEAGAQDLHLFVEPIGRWRATDFQGGKLRAQDCRFGGLGVGLVRGVDDDVSAQFFDRLVAEQLADEHAGDQRHSDARGQPQLRADAKIESCHRVPLPRVSCAVGSVRLNIG